MPVLPALRRFRNLYDGSDIERGTAAAALLTGRNPGKLPLEVEFRGHRMSANRAMGKPLGVVRNQCLHIHHPHNRSDANWWAQVVENFVKILKSRTGITGAVFGRRAYLKPVLRWNL
jgi:hypothetical protein